MRIAIVGAGGVGGLLSGMLARAAVDVTLVARGAHLEAIGRDGLQVDGAVGKFTARPRVVSRPEDAADADATLLAVKAWQVLDVAPSLRGSRGFVVPLQNGLEAYDRLAAVLGPERVVGGVTHMLAWTERPGLVRQSGPPPSVTVGEWGGAGSARLEALCAELVRAGVKAQVSPRIQADVWEKALFVEALGAVGAAIGLPVGRWRSIPESRALLEGAMRETAALAAAHGVHLGDAAVTRAMKRIDALPPDATASMHRDLHAHRPSELDDQTGSIVRLGARRDVPVAVHGFLYASLLPHERLARPAQAS